MLLPLPLRGFAVLDRFHTGVEGHRAGRGHDVETLRYDGLARGIRPGPDAAHRRDDEAAEPLHLESDFDRAKGGGGSDARPAGLRATDARRVSQAPRLRGRAAARYSWHSLRRAEGRILRVPEYRGSAGQERHGRYNAVRR